MLKFFVIVLILRIVETSTNSPTNSQVDNLMGKMQNKQFHQAERILKNVTEIETLYEISMKLLTLQDNLIKLMFFNLINNNNYKWQQSLKSTQIIQLWKALKLDLNLLAFTKMQVFLRDTENSMKQKCALQLKDFIITKNIKDFDNLTQDLSSLSLEVLQTIVKLSLTQTYDLILHSKLLHNLNLHTNLNLTKILYFIEFSKQLKAQKALNLNIAYKLALSLRYLLEKPAVYDQQIKLQLVNLKQALPLNIKLLVFSKKLCLTPEKLDTWYLSSFAENAFNLSLAISDNSTWLSFLVKNKLILELKSKNLAIFINYNHQVNDNFYDYHLKPLTAKAFSLLNSLTNQMLCLKNTETFWQNTSTLELDTTNCLWILNNCTSSKRFFINEYK